MPLTLFYSPSFERSVKRLGARQKITVGLILEGLEAYYASNCEIAEGQAVSSGFFYKQLRKPYYEAGIEGNIRVVLRREGTRCIAMLAGNHDQIRDFLSRV